MIKRIATVFPFFTGQHFPDSADPNPATLLTHSRFWGARPRLGVAAAVRPLHVSPWTA